MQLRFMKVWLQNLYQFFPIQLFLLHFRKYPLLIFIWVMFFGAVSSEIMKSFGGDALFFAPEYLGSVNILSGVITGICLGVFIMSWHITTFVLHSNRFRFLATTSHPFLKYCLNNSLLPILFIAFYFYKLYQYDIHFELMKPTEVAILIAGILIGLLLFFLFSFLYFFGTGSRIFNSISAIIEDPHKHQHLYKGLRLKFDDYGLKVKTYWNASLRPVPVRDVGHYRQGFIDAVMKRHHFAAMIGLIIAFAFLITIGFFLDNPFFAIPAAASIFVFFGILISIIGAMTYFLRSYSLIFIILLLIFFNFLYQKEIIDFRNKAYGLNYHSKAPRPEYTKANLSSIASQENISADSLNMIQLLNKWKANQTEEKPKMVFINATGGGLRSATFTMNTLQNLDSISQGKLMQKTFLISGASGGMLAAAYFRELYKHKQKDSSLNLSNKKYLDNISSDLLNSIFTSVVARDVLTPVQKFKVGNESYVKDRGYAFEKRLSDHSEGFLDIQLKDTKADEESGKSPLIIFNSVIKTDGRKMLIGTQPLSFMMKPKHQNADGIDAVDFGRLFSDENPLDLKLTTALRMNATFPYVLPNVWLPTNPVIDVMDAGLRDNTGQETSLRFITFFKDWLMENTSGIVLVQIRDRIVDNWFYPFETKTVTDIVISPGTMLQHNWFKMQNYFQADQYEYFGNSIDSSFISKINFMYIPQEAEKTATINFRITGREKRDVISSLNNPINQTAMKVLMQKIDLK